MHRGCKTEGLLHSILQKASTKYISPTPPSFSQKAFCSNDTSPYTGEAFVRIGRLFDRIGRFFWHYREGNPAFFSCKPSPVGEGGPLAVDEVLKHSAIHLL